MPPIQFQSLEPRQLFAAGDPLDTFGDHGQAFTPYELYSAEMSQVATTPGGKLLAAVGLQSFRSTRPGVAADFVQFNADGSPDMSFGSDGYVDSFFTTVRRISVRSDGKFYALGSTRDMSADIGSTESAAAAVTGIDKWYVARFLPNGQLDHSFGVRGKVAIRLYDRSVHEIGFLGESVNGSSYLDTDGRLTLLANYRPSRKSAATESAVFRYNASGYADSTFNGGSPVVLNTATYQLESQTMTLAPDGGVLVTAVILHRRNESTVIKRLNADGTPDTAFGQAGLLAVDRRPTQVPTAAVAADGSVFVSGNFNEYVNGVYTSSYSVLKFKADSTPDTAFAGGRVTFRGFTGLYPLLPLADGGVMVGGADGSLQRLHADGSVDAAFGSVENSSRMLVLSDDAVFALRNDAQTQVNRQRKPVSRFGVTAISLGGTDDGPVGILKKHLRFDGTSGDDSMQVTVVPSLSGSGTKLKFRRGFWTRTVPLAAVTSVDVLGWGGDDDIRATWNAAIGFPIVLHGGPGDDSLTGYGPNITAFGDAGDDTVHGDLTDGDHP